MNFQQLQGLNLGDVDAESDRLLSEYFIDTSEFYKVITDQSDLILGIKGSGKSAIFSMLVSKQTTDQNLANTIFIPSHQEESEAIEVAVKKYFKEMEGDYELVWLYVITRSLAQKLFTGSMSNEDSVKELQAKYNFDKTWNQRINLDKKIIYYRFIADTNEVLSKCNRRIWFLMDKLDKFFNLPEERGIRFALLSTLINVYLNIRNLQNVRLKIFLRTDLYHQLTGITDKDKISRQITLHWTQDKLIELIVNRIKRLNPSVIPSTPGLPLNDQFQYVFSALMGKDKKKGFTNNWLYNHLRDGNGVITPRDLIRLIMLSKDKELQKNRGSVSNDIRITGKSIKEAFSDTFSTHKYSDYLSNEFPDMISTFEKFRNRGSKYTRGNLASIVESEPVLNRLMETGFLRFINKELEGAMNHEDTFEIAEMYWGELAITRTYKR